MRDLGAKSAESLLRLHYRVLDELKARGIIRSASAPIGDYAEALLCEAFGWTRAGTSNPGYDAIDTANQRIQIKARRLVGNGSRQLGALRNLDRDPFDKLAAVLFGRNLDIARAAILPLETVKALSVHDPYTNSNKLFMEDEVWKMSGVQDVTGQVRATAREWV